MGRMKQRDDAIGEHTPGLVAPDARKHAEGLALELVREKLAAIPDIQEQCRRSGASFREKERTVSLDYLNQRYDISLPGGEIVPADAGALLSIREQLLILHYFTQARGTPPTGSLVTYKELIDGINYYPVFFKRAITPLITHFIDEPGQLIQAASTLDGYQSDYGDMAVTIQAFHHVALTFVLWRGDEELPPEGTILFDRTITDYLTNDDIHALCETVIWRLVKSKKAAT